VPSAGAFQLTVMLLRLVHLRPEVRARLFMTHEPLTVFFVTSGLSRFLSLSLSLSLSSTTQAKVHFDKKGSLTSYLFHGLIAVNSGSIASFFPSTSGLGCLPRCHFQRYRPLRTNTFVVLQSEQLRFVCFAVKASTEKLRKLPAASFRFARSLSSQKVSWARKSIVISNHKRLMVFKA
jgi:hypothetical protein